MNAETATDRHQKQLLANFSLEAELAISPQSRNRELITPIYRSSIALLSLLVSNEDFLSVIASVSPFSEQN